MPKGYTYRLHPTPAQAEFLIKTIGCARFIYNKLLEDYIAICDEAKAGIGSKNREKAKLLLAKKHEKIANQRKDFLHKLSRRIVDENQVIVVETLKSKDMMQNHKLAKFIGEVSWNEFVRQLEYKSNFYGRTLIKADPWYASTQICSSCGVKGEKKAMDVREWTCACGAHHDRDINASINLLMLAN